MPWTFSHPAAILPLKRFAPRYLNLPALVCGAMVPDLGYHFGRYDFANLAHTAAGSFWICIPTGWLCVLVFLLFRRPVWFLLPQPHRSVLAPLVMVSPTWNLRFFLSTTISIVLGAWTHIFWDSFTHAGRWGVLRIAALSQPWMQSATEVFYGYSILQHVSTLLGAAALCIAYLLWLRKQPRATPDGGGDKWRYMVIAGMAVACLSIAVPAAYDTAVIDGGRLNYSILLVNTAIYGVSAFALLLAAYSALYVIFMRRARTSPLQATPAPVHERNR